MGDRLREIRPTVAPWVTVAGMAAAFTVGIAAAVYGYWILAPVVVVVLALVAVGTWRRVGRNFTAELNLQPNLLLIALPTVIASSNIKFNASLYLLAVMAVAALWMKHGGIKLTWGCAIIPAASLAIMLRPNPPATTLTVLFYLLATVVTARAVYVSRSRAAAVMSLVDGIGLFLVASVVLRVVGVAGNTLRTAGLDNSLTGGVRVVFPLAGSLAATPAVAAVYVAAVVPVLMLSRQHRLLRVIGLVAAGYVLVLSDSRAALVAAVVLAVFVLFTPQGFRKAAPWATGGAFLVPFLYGYIRDGVATLIVTVGEYAPGIVREGERGDTLNGRDNIWARSIDFYTNRVDWISQAIGYGAHGTGKSGVTSTYNREFTGFGDKALITPHSSTLQLLFDGGWILTAVIVATVVYLARALARESSPVFLAGLSMLVALAAVGVSEVSLSPAHGQPTWWALMALAIIAMAKDSGQQDGAMDDGGDVDRSTSQSRTADRFPRQQHQTLSVVTTPGKGGDIPDSAS